MNRSSLEPEKPRVEPEIIPPDHSAFGRVQWDRPNRFGYHRVYVTRLGPFSTIALLFLIGMIVAALVTLFLGAVLLTLPVAAVLIVAAVIANYLRRPRVHHPRW